MPRSTSKRAQAPTVTDEAPVAPPAEVQTRQKSPAKPKQPKKSVESKPVETKPKKTKATKEPIKEEVESEQVTDPIKIRVDNNFTPSTIINFLKTYYKISPTIDGLQRKSVTIKDADVESKVKIPEENIIDLSNYKSIIEFVHTFIAVSQSMNVKNFKMQKVIESLFDLRLRGALDIIDTYNFNDKDAHDQLQELLFTQLDFAGVKDNEIKTYIERMLWYFDSEDRIRTKAYNTTFPHAVHRDGEDAKGVNVIYLQHSPAAQDEILEKLAEDIDTPLKVIDALVIEHFNDELTSAGIRGDELSELRQQLVNPLIIKNATNPPTITNKKGKEVVNTKWIEELHRVEVDGKKLNTLEDKLTELEVTWVRKLVRELSTSRLFVSVVKNAFENGVVYDETEKKNVRDERDISECVETYNKIMKSLGKFRVEQQKRFDKVCKKPTDAAMFKCFIETFVDCCKFMKEQFGYTNATKQFANDIKSNSINFNFTKELRKRINDIFEGNGESTVNEVVEQNLADWKYMNYSKSQDPYQSDIYAKIGKICGISIKREYRIGVGVAIVAWIQEQIRLISARNCKKRDIVIGVRMNKLVEDVREITKPFFVEKPVKEEK